VRVAAIYDIHGNLPALEAVLEEIRKAEVDHVVVGGDVVPGPMPRETLACLFELNVPVHFIQGNGERVVLAQLAGREIDEVPIQFREVVSWVAQQIDPEHHRQMANWPKTLSLEIGGLGDVLFCHATPRNDTDIFTGLTPEERLLPAFGGLSVHVVICGHTHMQFDRKIGTIRLVNAGSVGSPFGEPGAHWLIIGPDIEFRKTLYDLNRAAERIRATDYPRAPEFAEREVLQPPPEAEALELFSRAELR
jgi:putative phosphoesterase